LRSSGAVGAPLLWQVMVNRQNSVIASFMNVSKLMPPDHSAFIHLKERFC